MADIIINMAIFYNRHSELDKYRQLCCIADIIITLAVSYYRHSESSDWLIVLDATSNNNNTADDIYQVQNVGYKR
jgi:general stress protein CsbA